MKKRDKIIQAAVNIEGSAVMLSEKWDSFLIGYTIPEGTNTVLGVYDMTELVRGDIDREDAVIEELKAMDGGLKPVLVYTQCGMAEPFIRNGLHYLRQVDAGECKSLARARKRACWFESSFCNNDLTRK